MRDVTTTSTSVIDIWPYIGVIPPFDLQGHEIYDHFVEYVYRDGSEHFDHVFVMTKTPNVYLVIVIDIVLDCIYGHIILDLNAKYGITPTREGSSL